MKQVSEIAEERLIKERENGFAVKPKIKKPKGKHQEPLKNQKIQDFVMQGAVPGTLIEGGKDWVVGKYGRVLPIVHIPSKHGKKVQERSTEDRASSGDLPSTTTVTVVSSQTASNRMEPSSSTTELHKQGDKGDICGLISMGKSSKVLKNDRVTDSIEKERQKSRESELKRLESMMERSKETERKKKAIHQALALEGRQKKPALFDSSSENEDDEEIDEERFRIRPEYEGKAGKQLMKLQARFQNDERFRMDEKFIDEPDSSEVDSEEEEKHGNNNQKESSDEKSRAYKILGEVLGTTTVAKVERKKAMFRDVSAIHFDPTKEDHKQFEMEPNKKKEKVVKTNKDIMDSSDDEETQNAEKQNEELPVVTKERFYEVMSDSFKDAFSDKGPDLASKSFSLMSTFEGKEDSDTNDQDMFDSKEVPDKKKLEQTLWNPDGADRNDRIMSSDHEDGELYNPVRLCTSNQTFFFSSENDERVKEGISAFYRKEDFDEIRKEWLQNRQSLVNRPFNQKS
uniref:Nucleolar protein 8 n=1 Tax=Magallana gigas TaxID=29159 RepID=K1QHX1_MAGGI